MVPAEIVAIDNTFTYTIPTPPTPAQPTRTLDVLKNDISFAAPIITNVTFVGGDSIGAVTIGSKRSQLAVRLERHKQGLAQFVYTVTDDVNDPSRSKMAEVTVQVNYATSQGDTPATTTRLERPRGIASSAHG